MSSENARRVFAALGALVILLALLGNPPVHRTQEARVLVTAREMLGGDWLVPHMNGQLRLEKPPLAYWLAATAFKIGGVSEGVGRVPFAIAGWLTLIVTYFAGRWIGGERLGLLSAAILLGMWMFARNARFAETDILATLFITAAILCIWRGWHRGSGVMIGLALMAKGPPAMFPLIFLVALALANRDRAMIWRWIKSGAPLIALALGTPWYLYIAAKLGTGIFREETRNALLGEHHAAPFLQYFPQLALADLPWSIAALVAIVIAVQRFRTSEHARGLILWFAAIFLPLLFIQQRQFHYLLPTLPALAILTAWLFEIAAPNERFTRIHLLGTRRPILIAAICAVVTLFVAQVIVPSSRATDPRAVAARIKAIGPGPYCFFGTNISLPLVFYLGQKMTQVETPEELSQVIGRSPGMIVIAQTKSGVSPPPAPPGFVEVAQIEAGEQLFEVYRHVPAAEPN